MKEQKSPKFDVTQISTKFFKDIEKRLHEIDDNEDIEHLLVKRHDIVDETVKEDIPVWKRPWLSVDALVIAKGNQEE